MKLHWMLIFMLIISTAGYCADKGASDVKKQEKLNVMGLDMFSALDCGGEIYLCRIVKRTPANTSDKTIERGKVELEVVKTICGVSKDTLTLPYSFPLQVVKSDYFPIWPVLNEIKERYLICTVVPSGYEPAAGIFDNVSGAASEVLPVSGEKDPVVQGMESFCALYKNQDVNTLKISLAKVLIDPQPRIRLYAFRLAVSKLAAVDPNGAITLIKNSLEHLASTGSDPQEISQIVSLIENAFKKQVGKPFPSPAALENFGLRCLGELLGSSQKSVRETALFSFASYIGMATSKATDVFDRDKSVGLEKILQDMKASGDKDISTDASEVLKWLAASR